ncbi:MAG: site-2 protease family protein [Candidatus Hadarchaeales archaeon]
MELSQSLLLLLLGLGSFWAIFLLFYREGHLKKYGFSLEGGMLLWRTERGLRIIDRVAKKRRKGWIWFGEVGTYVGLFLMFFVFFNLLLNAYFILRRPELSVAGARFVLPGVIPGLTVYWWLISVAVVLLVHEVSHGLLMRAQGIPTKSVGLLLFIALPGAFVEPDEKKLNASPLKKRLRIFAAGSFANILVGLLTFFFLFLLLSPLPGVRVWGVRENGPCENLELGTLLLSLNGKPLHTWRDYVEGVENLKPGEEVVLETDRGTFVVTADNRDNRGSLGIWPVSSPPRSELLHPLSMLGLMVNELLGRPALPPYTLLHPYFYRSPLPWPLVDLLKWIFVLDLGIGMFNLLPLVPLDGGYMFRGLLELKMSKKRARQFSNFFSLFLLFILLLNLFPSLL